MTEPENTGRFTGLAEIYAAHRPTYPQEIVAALSTHTNATQGLPKKALDVGCGTGISTRVLAQALPDWQIIGAEPNGDMRAKAIADCIDLQNVSFMEASAEYLPIEDASAGLIIAAQALHWFDIDAFTTEAARVLPPGGTLAILYNNRQNDASAVLREIESFLEEMDPQYSRNYRNRDMPTLLENLDTFTDVRRERRVWLRPTSTDDLVNYFLSRSMLQPIAKKIGLSKLRFKIGDIADEHATAAMLNIPFATELDMATRK